MANFNRRIRENSDRIYCNGKELAYVLGITSGRVSQLDAEDVFQRREIGNGEQKYELAECVQSYIVKVVQNISTEDVKTRTEKAKAEADIKKAKAVIADLEAQELQGKMHRAEDVVEIFQNMLYEIRSMIMSLPGQLATDVANAENAAEAAAIIRTATNQLLMDMSKYKYDPKVFEERVRERQKWTTEAKEEDDDL